MQINFFNGGLNTRLAPHLIGANESTICENVDVSKGSLTPINEHKHLNTKIKPNLVFFNNHWVSEDIDTDFVEFQGKLFKSDGVNKPQWSPDGFNWYQLGIDAPSKDSIKAQFIDENVDLKIKPLYGFKDGYIDSFIFKTTGFLGFSKGSVSSSSGFSYPARKKFEVFGNIVCSVWEEGNDSNKKELSVGCYKSYLNTPDNFAPVLRRTSSTGGQLTIQPVYNIFPMYVKTNTENVYKSKLSRATTNSGSTQSEYLSTVGGGLKDIRNLVKPQLGDEIKFVIYDDKDQIVSILSDNIPSTFNQTKFPTLPPAETLFAGFSFEWVFQETDKVIIFLNGVRYVTKTYSDIDFDNRVWVNIYYFDSDGLETIDSIINSVSNIEYVITYSNSLSESAPSESVSVPFYTNTQTKIVLDIQKSDDPQVSNIKLYRRGVGLTKFSLVKVFPNRSFQYIEDLSLNIDGAVLNSYNNTPAPQGLRYITSNNTMLFGTLNEKLVYTNINTPFYWDSLNFIDFESEITGLGETPNGMLVFTKDKTHIITGTSPSTFSKYLLTAGVGCRLHKSIKTIKNNLIWLAYDGLYSSNGGSVTPLTHDKISDFNLKIPRCSAVLKDVYYLSHLEGTFIADFRYGVIFSQLKDEFYGLSLYDSKLFGVDNQDNLIELFGDTKLKKLHYKSPNFPDGALSNTKVYKTIYFHSEGELIANVFIDSKQVGSYTLNNGFTEVNLPSADTRGNFISFEVTGTGTLNEIEYKVEGRQNGR